MFLGIARKFVKNKSVLRTVILRLLTTGIAVYGLYEFRQREIGSYMLMKIQFAFFNMQEPLFKFMLDYLAVMGLFAVIGYYIMYVIKLIKKKGRVIYES